MGAMEKRQEQSLSEGVAMGAGGRDVGAIVGKDTRTWNSTGEQKIAHVIFSTGKSQDS
jgi:hypothetical protein